MRPTRRSIVVTAITLPGVLAATASRAFQESEDAQASVASPYREPFRFCGRCQTLFHSSAGNGRCLDDQTHSPVGWTFHLFAINSELIVQPSQDKWGQCRGCRTVFYNGYPDKGKCPALGSHQALRNTQLWLERDRPLRRREQADWRFCTKCSSLFYDSSNGPGRCFAGGQHSKAGYNFILRSYQA